MPEDICSKCGKYPASVFTKKIKNGQIFVEGLCEKCAGKAGETSPGSPDKQTSTISKPKRHSFLDKYGISLTQKAKDGKVQKLIGREREIKQIIEVLCRMNKSNPCLIGPPGSGKTVIAEWLAKLILDKDKKIPRKLQDKEIYVLDVTTLTAGMGKFGDLEERIGFIINEVEERGNVIIFIDEIHRIVGAGVTEGNPAGGIDNMLKPALARDKFQLISATTREEYKIIEKDAALERRFQTVIIDESTVEDTIEILLGIKDRFETHYEIIIPDDVIRKTVVLAEKYITGKFFPDKAITLIDQAGGSLHMQNEEALATGMPVSKELTIEYITRIIEDQTKIPVTNINEDDSALLLNLEEKMKESIIGQDGATETVVAAIKRKRVGTSKKLKPVSFIFIGSTGIGKTEFAKRLNEKLFGSSGEIIRIDMSELMSGSEKGGTETKLIGAPPGYVGYGEPGLLEPILANPFSVVLLDEIEKAHPDVMNIFLQILDEGHVTDSQRRKLDFRHAIIIMTTNAGSSTMEKTVGFSRSADEDSKQRALDGLKKFLRPELINRVDDVVYFTHLNREDIKSIARIMLDDLSKAMSERDDPITLTYTEDMLDYLVDKGYSEEYGARNLRRIVEKDIENMIADEILKNHASPITAMELSVLDDAVKINVFKE